MGSNSEASVREKGSIAPLGVHVGGRKKYGEGFLEDGGELQRTPIEPPWLIHGPNLKSLMLTNIGENNDICMFSQFPRFSLCGVPLRQLGPNLMPTLVQLGPTWNHFGPRLDQLGPNLASS